MIDDNFFKKQLGRLPLQIGKYSRRDARINDAVYIQYTTKGLSIFSNPKNVSEFAENDVLYSETGNNIKEVVEQILANIDVDRRIESYDHHSEPFFYISKDLIDQGITKISIIQSTGMATMIAPCIPISPGWSQNFFTVQADDYLLAFGRRGNIYFFRRNDVQVNLPIPQESIIADKIAIAIVWNLNEIGISGFISSRGQREIKPDMVAQYKDWKQTVPTVPPNSLYTWARKQLLLARRNYIRLGQVFNVVIEALRALNEEISISNDLGAFWDEQRNGNKIDKLIQKREPLITRHIESRIRDITLQNNIDIAREIQIGNSKLDLLFSAPLKNGDTVKVCVEVKEAHSGEDLAHGLSIQLPEYMRRIGTDFGIYCVLYFGKDYQHQVNPFRKLIYTPDFDSNIQLYQNNLEILLNNALSSLPFKNIVAIVLDVSHRPSASKM